MLMIIRNRFKYWRHFFQFDKAKDFAAVCGISESLYNRYENHRDEPGREKLWLVWTNLKKLKNDLHIEDLLEESRD